MKTACFIPIKENSERVPGKNLRILNGKKLYEYIIEHVKEAEIFDEIFIDTNSREIEEYVGTIGGGDKRYTQKRGIGSKFC